MNVRTIQGINGFSYITVLEDSMESFAPVIELLR